jgi:hypothetical protein
MLLKDSAISIQLGFAEKLKTEKKGRVQKTKKTNGRSELRLARERGGQGGWAEINLYLIYFLFMKETNIESALRGERMCGI